MTLSLLLHLPTKLLQDFLSILETKVMPSKGREMRCCILKGTLNYKAFFEQLDISISGLVPNAKGGEPDVNHSWRFIAREEPYFPVFGKTVLSFEGEVPPAKPPIQG